MLVTNLAYRDLEARADGMAGFLTRLVHLLRRRPAGPAVAGEAPPDSTSRRYEHMRALGPDDGAQSDPLPFGADSGEPFRWRRHPQLLHRSGCRAPVDREDSERSARSAAVRGLFLARSGRIAEARSAFAIAATEPTVDLSAIPGFWGLSRSGMLAAVEAYDDVERYRDASALGAQIRSRYRPQPLSVVPGTEGERPFVSRS